MQVALIVFFENVSQSEMRTDAVRKAVFSIADVRRKCAPNFQFVRPKGLWDLENVVDVRVRESKVWQVAVSLTSVWLYFTKVKLTEDHSGPVRPDGTPNSLALFALCTNLATRRC